MSELAIPRNTALLFVTNIFHAHAIQASGLYYAWTIVLATSLLYHGSPDTCRIKSTLRRVDQGAVACLVTVGGVYWWHLPMGTKMPPFFLFVSCLIFYAYGYCRRCFCFAKPPHDRAWHSVLHLTAVAGHHLLMYGMW